MTYIQPQYHEPDNAYLPVKLLPAIAEKFEIIG